MARTKQVKPVERTPSSEFVSKQNGTPVKRTSSYVIPKEASSNGATLAGKSAVMLPEPEKKEAGIVQLVIAVAGIYGSLYVMTISNRELLDKC